MNTRIVVHDRNEARHLRAGLQDPAVRAFVKVVGILSGLPTDRAKRRVLEFVRDSYDEGAEGNPR